MSRRQKDKGVEEQARPAHVEGCPALKLPLLPNFEYDALTTDLFLQVMNFSQSIVTNSTYNQLEPGKFVTCWN